MKRLVIAGLFLFAVLSVEAANPREAVKSQAQACASAISSKDFGKAVSYFYPELVEMSGGRAKMIAMLKQSVQQMKAHGTELQKITVGEPGPFKTVRKAMLVLIPETTIIKVHGGHLTHQGYLVGISRNHGRTWKFVDVSNGGERSFAQVCPDLAGSIKIPQPMDPTFQKDSGK